MASVLSLFVAFLLTGIIGLLTLVALITAAGAYLAFQHHDIWTETTADRGRGLVTSLFVAGLVYLIIELIESSITFESSKRTSNSRNWPTVTAVEKLTAYLPTMYPFERHAHVWPPFTGVRVELGGGDH